ncbi:MAG: D-cysteine desulfhydrase family protein [bacterium]|nr:D-cysteine desulfhydrase family protein [bacterium]
MPHQKLDRFKTVKLGHWPTPLEPLDRLSALLGGPSLFVKRDDCSGLALGGNKVRKLEYLLADAIAQGADTIITVGGVQSNHARQTAAAAARVGLACELVLPRLVPGTDPESEKTGNVLLDHLLGAQVHIVDDYDAAAERVGEVNERVLAGGGKPAFIPPGGSTEIGSLGFAAAAVEMRDQLESADLHIDRIVLAVSSGGTQAGLVAGLAMLDLDVPVTGICVYADAEETHATVASLVETTADRLEIPTPPDESIRVDGKYLGDGYGVPTNATTDALHVCARVEGLLLDPVYTGKAMGGLIEAIREGEIGPGENVLFWHTGGAPALFAYPTAV